MNITAFWDIALCCLVEVDGRFRVDILPLSSLCPDETLVYSVRLHGTISQKAVIVMFSMFLQ
jgi:hypothetical protein